jgi:hypothetical protein
VASRKGAARGGHLGEKGHDNLRIASRRQGHDICEIHSRRNVSRLHDSKRYTGTGHGTPYYYDQRVPVGFGIRSGEYLEAMTPADTVRALAR